MSQNNLHLGSIFLHDATKDKRTDAQPVRVQYEIVSCMMECHGECGGMVTPHEHLGTGWSCSICGTVTTSSN